MKRSVLALGAVLVLAACGEKNVDASGETDGTPVQGDPCVPDGSGESPCAEGLVCEVNGDSHVCATPLEIRGVVLDALSREPIAGAHVTALDATGAPVGSVSVSDELGRYSIHAHAARDDSGGFADTNAWTLFATAADYEPFPGGLRPAIPLNAEDATDDDDDDDDDGDDGAGWILENPSTDVALVPIPSDGLGGRTVSGTVGGAVPGGTLVVAEGGQPPSRYTVADADGTYTLFNVSPGTHSIVGYRSGLDVDPAPIDGDDDLTGVDLQTSGTAAASTVRGTVNIVNAPGGSETSVVLVPASVYNEGLERGPVPLGLRAPEAPQTPSVAGAFEIAGVPPGRYKVLAAFENDELVRDPDENIAGTNVVEIEVTNSDVEVSESFKVTEGLTVVFPGAEAPEVVDAPPVFVFADDASEDRYEVVVLDAFGNIVWEDLAVPGVSGSETVQVEYGGPTLEFGRYYQFRATSVRENPNADSAISRTEDLRGVFISG
ncbi:MAG: carboxypeptidase-like regulatory domain-containing protein [Nannocystales bacterium]